MQQQRTKRHPLTKELLKKIKHMVTVKHMRYYDIAKTLGDGWTLSAIGHICQREGITNGLHGGRFTIPAKELEFLHHMLNQGYTYGDTTVAMNAKFGTNYTSSTLKHRAKTRGWKAHSSMTGLYARWTDEEISTIKKLHLLNAPVDAYLAKLPGRSWHGIRKKIFDLIRLNQIKTPLPPPNRELESLQKFLRSRK